MSKSKKLALRKKIALGLLHHIVGHRSTISLMSSDTECFWRDIEYRIDTDPFCASCQIYLINKKDSSKNPLDPKAPFKWGFRGIITATATKRLTIEKKFLIII